MEPKLIVHPDGTKEWRLNNGLLHRVDGPAVIRSSHESWWFKGLLHRVDGPAVTYPNSYQAWYLMGRFHRVDGPAIIHTPASPDYTNGYQEWFLHGKYVRWGDVLKRIGQPGHVLSPLEVSMIEHYLEDSYGT